MNESMVYTILLSTDPVTFGELIRRICIVADETAPLGPPLSWQARVLLGNMIANREITIADDGTVHII